MLDKIQFLLSLQIIGFCIFGGATLLLRAGDNRAKRILGWGMFLWAFLAAIRLSVNLYLHKPKEAFHPDILLMGALVTATLACYVIEVLRPGFLTCKRFFLFISPVVFGGLAYLTYRLSGGEIHTYYSIREVFEYLNMDVLLRMTVFLLTLFYMILPVYLIARYSKDFNVFLAENVSDPEEYDLEWLRKTMIILIVLYGFYLVLLLTNTPLMYVIDKTVLLFVWYYFFYLNSATL